MAVDSMGTCYTWGAGSYGRLGHGEEADILVPKRVDSLEVGPLGTNVFS
jgi:hypothetical protein